MVVAKLLDQLGSDHGSPLSKDERACAQGGGGPPPPPLIQINRRFRRNAISEVGKRRENFIFSPRPKKRADAGAPARDEVVPQALLFLLCFQGLTQNIAEGGAAV